MERLLDGYYTMSDQRMYDLLGLLNQVEGIQLEPSALAGMVGPIVVADNDEYLNRMGMSDAKLANATHLVWATGGGMVPAVEMEKYLSKASR